MKSLSQQICAVCGQQAAGWHFGAFTCRACAAFFRRSWGAKRSKECKKGTNKCAVKLDNGFYNCKKCRLQKCFDSGMKTMYFQFDKRNTDKIIAKLQTQQKVTPTLNTFLGRSNLIIFSLRADSFTDKPKRFIDVEYLMDKAVLILREGVETPIFSKTDLGKLAFGLDRIRNSPQNHGFPMVKKIGREESLALWERDFLKLINWLNYFEAFRKLPKCLQITMATSVWCVWNKLLCLSVAATEIRKQFSEEMLRRMPRDTVIMDWSAVEFDMSWCSSYPLEQVKCFVDIPTDLKMDESMRLMIELDPTAVELSYMLCQLSFHYAGKKHQGEVLKLVEKFQESLADDLHRYYVEDMNNPRYSSRLSSMMKINNLLQEEIRKNRERIKLAIMFEIMDCECSHPEMFLNA